ncbi:MAG: type II toxin-antitoxin system VapC family toxin [Candidatus Brockarchaeota archaeon]|nr:type II toxin-antitoxin system VapC family toxin [Candidatus Brockarchaeota archaeon]
MPFVDSNIFVYHLTAEPLYGKTARKIIERIENGEESYTSTLVIAQVCSYLKWKKKHDVIPLFLSFLKGLTSLQKIETSILDFEEARNLQKQQNLPWTIWDDIVVSAQMKRINIKEIYSNDKDFDKIPWVIRLF